MIINPGQLNPYDLDLSKLKILIIDDFVDMRSMMKRTVESFKATYVESAKEGDDALTKMGATRFDVVLCDYNLGDGKDGQQILEEAKHRKYISSTTIWMMVTAETTVEMVMGALEYKPDDYLTKPFTKQEFAVRLLKIQHRKNDLRDILVARDEGDFEKALTLVDTHLDKKELFELLQIKADLFERMGQWGDADEVYKKVMAARMLPWAQLGHGRMLVNDNHLSEAKETLNAAIAQMPSLVEAYDVLAQIYEVLDDTKGAQRVLEDAVAQSPKAILRQKRLARLAYENKDLDTAEKAYRRVIKMGRGSVYKSVEDVLGLAKVYASKGESADAIKALSNIREDYKHDQDSLLHGQLVESEIYQTLGLKDQATKALDDATELAAKITYVKTGIAQELIRTALAAGRAELAQRIAIATVNNHHDEESLVEALKKQFADAGWSVESRAFISQAQGDIRDSLARGSEFVKQGDLNDAITHFNTLVSTAPNNVSANLALAQTYVKLIQKSGNSEKLLYSLRQSLDRVTKLAPQNALLATLRELYRQLVRPK